MVFFADDESTATGVIDKAGYLEEATVAGYGPEWLHPEISRDTALRVIQDQAMQDGTFLVREKVRQPSFPPLPFPPRPREREPGGGTSPTIAARPDLSVSVSVTMLIACMLIGAWNPMV